MKIQISPTKIVKDCLTVWNEHGPEVDVVMDPKNLTFKPGSIDEMYAMHVLDGLFPDEVITALKNWRSCLKMGGKLFILVDDFEYVARAFIGGDISIDLYNDIHNHPTQHNREGLVSILKRAGFRDDSMNIWLAEDIRNGLFSKKHYELVIESTKNE